MHPLSLRGALKDADRSAPRTFEDQPLLQQPNGRRADNPHRLLAMLAGQGDGLIGFHQR
jgi:hypothetical protein